MNAKKLFGIKVDCRLKFENCLDGVIKKASNKINALSRVTPFLNLSKSFKVKTLNAFKSGIKNWWPQNCPCRLCERYLPNISFV